MAETSPSEERQDAPDTSQPPGEILAQAREAMGLSRIRVSELLGLTQSTVRDIELGRFEKFPSGIYARGYIRNYCKLVEVDEQRVLAAYDLYGETHEIPEESPFGTNEPDVSNTGDRSKVIIGIVVVVLVALVALVIFS